jgi:hypothetical protein
MTRFSFFFWIALLVLSACQPVPASEPTPTLPPPTDTPTSAPPTETIVWFPATATWTPFPTLVPSATPNPFPGLGAQTFADDFTDPAAWTFAKTEGDGGNNVILNRDRLTLAVNVPPAFIFSVNKSLALRDFYAETSVRVNRCAGTDAYGLLFHSQGDYYAYRFVVNCKGETRAERMRGGEIMRLLDWVPSGDAPPGAPGLVKMGIWVSGAEMRFFLNGRYQFSAVDTTFKTGTLGFFVNAASAGGMNVSFSALTVNEVSYVSPTPTLTPSRTPRSTKVPTPTP